MSEVHSKINDKIDWAEIQKFTFSYLKIIGMSFIIPIWMATFANGIALLWKIATWAQHDIMFWEVKQYLSFSLLILFIPLVYLVWFYYLTIKKVLLKVHKDFFKKWTTEFSTFAAQSLIQQYAVQKEGKGKMDIEKIMMWMTEKISRLPNWLGWITKKLIDQIPIVELINAYDFKNLENGNEEKLAADLNQKIDKMQLSMINSFVPWWTKLIIPVNILLLILYIKFQ